MPPKKDKNKGKKRSKKAETSSSESESARSSDATDSDVEDSSSSSSEDEDSSSSSSSESEVEDSHEVEEKGSKNASEAGDQSDVDDVSNHGDVAEAEGAGIGDVEQCVKDIKKELIQETGTPPKLTAKGHVRIRNAWWSKEEQQSLFLTCMRHEEVLKRTGADPHGEKKDAWQKVIDAVNSVDKNARSYDEIRKQINDFYSKTKKLNESYKASLSNHKRVQGCTPAEILCLKWKDVEEIVGPKGKMVYHRPKFGKKAAKLADKAAKLAEEKVVEKRHGHKKTKKRKKTVSKKVKNKHRSKSPRHKKDKDNEVSKSKAPTPKKTIRNRLPLPDLDDMDDEGSKYVLGDLYKKSKAANVSTETHLVSSGDDDLKETYYSYSENSSSVKREAGEPLVDLTGPYAPTTSTPNEVQKAEVVVPRRSPRNTNKYEEKATAKTAKKTLTFDDKNKKPEDITITNTINKPKVVDSKAAMSAGTQSMGAEEEDVNMRVARLESLISTFEMDRRENDKYRRESEYKNKETMERYTTLLERITADRKVLLDGFKYATENQTNIIRVMASLTYLVAGATKKSDKSSQTPHLPVLDAQPLIVKSVDVNGSVMEVQAVPSTEQKDAPVTMLAAGTIVMLDDAAVDLSVGCPAAVNLSNPALVQDSTPQKVVVKNEEPVTFDLPEEEPVNLSNSESVKDNSATAENLKPEQSLKPDLNEDPTMQAVNLSNPEVNDNTSKDGTGNPQQVAESLALQAMHLPHAYGVEDKTSVKESDILPHSAQKDEPQKLPTAPVVSSANNAIDEVETEVTKGEGAASNQSSDDGYSDEDSPKKPAKKKIRTKTPEEEPSPQTKRRPGRPPKGTKVKPKKRKR